MKTWSWMRAWVWGVWDVDEPEEFESALQCSAGAAQRGYPVLEGLLIGDVGVERVEVGDGGEAALWIFAEPSCGVLLVRPFLFIVPLQTGHRGWFFFTLVR